jgi:hypothetical protein
MMSSSSACRSFADVFPPSKAPPESVNLQVGTITASKLEHQHQKIHHYYSFAIIITVLSVFNQSLKQTPGTAAKPCSHYMRTFHHCSSKPLLLPGDFQNVLLDGSWNEQSKH